MCMFEKVGTKIFIVVMLMVCYSYSYNTTVINDPNIDDRQEIQDALDLVASNGGGTVFLNNENGDFEVDGTIYLQSWVNISGNHTSIIFDNINSSDSSLFNFNGADYITIEDVDISSKNNGTAFNFTTIYYFKVNPNDTTKEDTTQNASTKITLNNIKISGFNVGIYSENLHSALFNNLEIFCKKGLLYTAKSGEVTISNSWIKNTGFGEVGIHCYASPKYASLLESDIDDSNKIWEVPEGLTVFNTLFYQMEKNLIIDDLFIGTINNCYFDNGGKSTDPIIINYKHRSHGLTFSNSWFLGRGIHFERNNTADSAKLFESRISNCFFNFMSPGATIYLGKFSHDISINDCQFGGSNTNGYHVGIQAKQKNQRIKLSDLTFRFYDHSIYMRDSDANSDNMISNISNNNSRYANPIDYDFPVNVRNVGIPKTGKCDLTAKSYQSDTSRIEEFGIIGTMPISNITKGTVVDVTLLVQWENKTDSPFFMLSAPDFHDYLLFPIREQSGNLSVTIPFIATKDIVDSEFTLQLHPAHVPGQLRGSVSILPFSKMSYIVRE